jgi:hypothetical protein
MVTNITDQAKGLTQSIADVLPSTGHFQCSYHRHQNILKFVGGGSQKYSCLWLYSKLMKAKTLCQIEQIKHKHAPFVNDMALKYLNEVDDTKQYPGARAAVDYSRIIMYQRSASSAMESMNQANKAARDRTQWMWYVLPNSSCLCQARGIMRRKKWHGNGKGT